MTTEESERDRFYRWWQTQPGHQPHDGSGCFSLTFGEGWTYDEAVVDYAWKVWRAAMQLPGLS